MAALDEVVAALRCPLCAAGLQIDGRRLVCSNGHSYDIARQGYANLLTGRGGPGTGDTAAMVEARARFLTAGHYAPIAARVAAATAGPLVLDLAGGAGYHLAHVLEQLPNAAGLCLDLDPGSAPGGAGAPAGAAIGADAWQPLPIATGAVDTVLSVFGPRDPAEIDRVLGPAGRLVVVSPRPAHLGELIEPLGMVGVDPRKPERQSAAFAAFAVQASDEVTYRLRLDHEGVAAVVGMGPTASHVDAVELAARITGLPGVVEVQVAVQVTVYGR